jgi:hypothetical protein
VTRRRLLLLVGALAALGFMPSMSAARADTATAATTNEAWYAPPPTCSLPTGCGPTDSVPPVSRYPAGTLHVGDQAGFEEARTYLKLNLGAVPAGASLTGGTLTIPVAPSADGTSSPDTAQVVACRVTAAFTAVEGSPAPPPAIDCGTTTTAHYAAGPPAVLTVDLTPFTARWSTGEPNNGIALLPVTSGPSATTWDLAFSARTRTGSQTPPASAALVYDPAPSESTDAGTTTPDLSAVDTGATDLGAINPPVDTGPALPAATPAPVAQIIAQSRQPTVPAVEVSGPGFAYPVILVLPLLLLGLGGYLGWALTRPVGPAQH